ncbi:MAG TPA: hypothetical protein VM580_23810 [Labilithrix sp.]|nr:hypothetical protein [Labilithrix sp.]
MRSPASSLCSFALVTACTLASRFGYAQEPSDPEPSPAPAPPSEPPPPVVEEEEPPSMSEGRLLVSLYNTGFQWGIAPGIIISRGKAGFAFGARFGYGFDTGSVILVPGVRLLGLFADPNVYMGMPTFKVVFPIDRFAPFLEAGAGVGHVTEPAGTGFAAMGGVGFMVHFKRVALGLEGSYQLITGTDFAGFGFGPILAIGL